MSIDANAIAAKLRTTFEDGRTRPVAWRHEQLDGLSRMLDESEERIVDALRADLGRPRAEAFAADVGHTRGELRHLRSHVERWMRPRKVRVPLLVAPAKGYITPEPLGVALVIAPWNYPIQLLVEPIAAALAAGNCVAAKPSELAPACSELLAELLPRFVDPEAVTVVEGGVPETTALLAQRWDHIFFTGSTEVGRIVARAAAEHLTPTTLELGGKSPCYVHRSADLAISARRIVWGKFVNAGQTCIAPDYVLVDRAVRDDFVRALGTTIAESFGTDPKSSTSFGRIVNERHAARLEGLLHGDGVGQVAVGGRVDVEDRYVAPTVVLEPETSSALMADEIFGPILPVLAVSGPEEAADFINARPKPLALYAFGTDSTAVDTVVNGTSSGGVCVNQTLMHLLPPNLPFGGVGDSGMGAYHGQSGFDRFSHLKPVLRKGFKPDVRLLYPPYSKLAERLIRRLLR